MTTKNLLVELFVEELPPKALQMLGESFANGVLKGLNLCHLITHAPGMRFFASPRRLAVFIPNVEENAQGRNDPIKLMPVSIGLDATGNATPALLKKLSSLGADASAVPQLRRQMDGKAEALFFDRVVSGDTLKDGLQKTLKEALTKLPIPKVMQYQLADGWTSVNFVRPAHGLVALHGEDIVPVQVLGLTAGRNTHGHRFEARVDPIVLKDADSYAAQLETEGAVIASFAKRRADIERQLKDAATKIGSTPIHDEALLDEVTALVERPNVLICQFEKEFLEVPQECLILTMKANQKYFPLLDAQGKLTNQFLVVSNISPADPSRVIEGNERVVRPRLADAKFFFDQDRKKKLEDRVAGLDKVVYHNKLGTQGERSLKVKQIAIMIAGMLNKSGLEKQVGTAAALAKTDLLTDMVGEFPELQGIMGRYYALNDGLSIEIADAIEDHYKPRFAGDSLPRNQVGLVVALADKLETLVGLFGIGQIPTGDKDPFALRRHALGVIRILMECDLPLNLDELLFAAAGVRGFSESVWQAVSTFMFERLTGLLREQGYSVQEVDAVVSQRPQRLGDIPRRLVAVRAFSSLPEATSLAAANKRVGNILKKSDAPVSTNVNESLPMEEAERHLHGALKNVAPLADSLFHNGEYAASLRELAVLKGPVDAFFDSVMVNADDPAIRANRLGLLAQLHAAMNRVADLSKLAA